MKCNRLTLISAAALVALAMQVPLCGQETQEHKKEHHRYKLIDLGTFGGPASHVAIGFNGVNASGGILDKRGTTVGWAETDAPDPYPAFCFNPDCFVSHAFRWRNGALADLGTLPGGTSSQAFGISANGLVVGNSQNGKIDPLVPGFPEVRAVLWRHDDIIDLGTLEGGHESQAGAVNSRGQVVGASNNTIPDAFSLVLNNGFQVLAFLWQKGEMKDLGSLGGPDAIASFVNERGRIAGLSYTNTTPNPVTGIPTVDPFIWVPCDRDRWDKDDCENESATAVDGKMLDLGTLGGTLGYPTALNNRGQVTGQSSLAGDMTSHPFLWDRGVLTDLGTLGGDNGTTNWINEEGEVAGKADLPGPRPQKHDAVVWKNGKIIDLGTVPGDSCSNAESVNSRGQVVGTSENQELCSITVGEHAFLWEHGGPMVDLNTLVPPESGLQLTYALAINERGEIAGIGVPAGVPPQDYPTKAHAYILIPCDQGHADTESCEDAGESAPALIQKAPK